MKQINAKKEGELKQVLSPDQDAEGCFRTRATHSALAHILNVVYPDERVAAGHCATDHP